jgi:hypothetical protein
VKRWTHVVDLVWYRRVRLALPLSLTHYAASLAPDFAIIATPAALKGKQGAGRALTMTSTHRYKVWRGAPLVATV